MKKITKEEIRFEAEKDVKIFNSQFKEIYHESFVKTFIRAVQWYENQINQLNKQSPKDGNP